MSWGKNKTRPESVIVDSAGLEKIVRDLWNFQDVEETLYRGVQLGVRPNYKGMERADDGWIVLLTSRQTDVLLSRLPRKTLQGEYGVSS